MHMCTQNILIEQHGRTLPLGQNETNYKASLEKNVNEINFLSKFIVDS